MEVDNDSIDDIIYDELTDDELEELWIHECSIDRAKRFSCQRINRG